MKARHVMGWTIAAIGCLCCGQAPPAEVRTALTAKTTVVQFYSSQPASPEDQRRLGENSAPLSRGSYVSFQALVEFSAPLTNVKASGKVIAFTDDRGTDLSKNAAVELVNLSGDRQGPLSTDHRAVVLTVHTDVRPAAGARRVSFKGSVSVQRDAGTDTTVVKDVPLRLGAAISAGNMMLHIQSMNEGPTYTNITLRTANLAALQKVEFLDAQGRPMDQESYVQRDSIALTDKTVEQTISYSVRVQLHETATLRITLYKGAEMEEVPFEATAGIGM